MSMIVEPRVIRTTVLKSQSVSSCPLSSILCRRPPLPRNTCWLPDPPPTLGSFPTSLAAASQSSLMLPLLFLCSERPQAPPDLPAVSPPSLVISSRLSTVDAVCVLSAPKCNLSLPLSLCILPKLPSRMPDSHSYLLIQHLHPAISKYLRFNSNQTGASLIAQLVKNPPAMQETPVRFLDREDPLEKG